jgi:polynucleotide 5'-kinase involved in rRNA processing
MPKGFPPIHEFTSRDLEGLVLGLLDDSGYMLHFGILLDVENDKLRVFSKSVEGVRRVEVGYVRLSMNGTELGYFEPWMYR